MKSLRSAYLSFLGNESYLVNTSTIEFPYERLIALKDVCLSLCQMN
jgi:hypothetical protein